MEHVIEPEKPELTDHDRQMSFDSKESFAALANRLIGNEPKPHVRISAEDIYVVPRPIP